MSDWEKAVELENNANKAKLSGLRMNFFLMIDTKIADKSGPKGRKTYLREDKHQHLQIASARQFSIREKRGAREKGAVVL